MHRVRAFRPVPTNVMQQVVAYLQPFRRRVLRCLDLAGGVSNLAVTRDGRLVLGARLHHVVRVCSAAGDLLTQWGVPEPLGALQDLAVSSEATPHVILTDGVGLTVASMDGQALRHWTPPLSAHQRMIQLCFSGSHTLVALCRHMWEPSRALMVVDYETGRVRMQWATQAYLGECPRFIAASEHYVAVLSHTSVAVFSVRDGTQVMRDTVMLIPVCWPFLLHTKAAKCVCLRGNEVLVYHDASKAWIVYHIATGKWHRCHEVNDDPRAPTQDARIVSANGLVYLLVWSGCGYQLTVMD